MADITGTEWDKPKLCTNCGKALTKVPLKQKDLEGKRKIEYKEIGICQDCAKNIVKKPFKDENNKTIWKNILSIDIQSLIMIIIVLTMAFAFQHDVSICQDAVSNPCVFCATTNCYNPKTKCSNVDILEFENLNIQPIT